MSSLAIKRLMKEYKEITKDPPEGIIAGPVSEDDFFTWEVLITGPEGSAYENGIFPAILKFPSDYPLNPPTMIFKCEMFHPNIYSNGNVCISILHPPGDDPNMYELASERWSPIQSIEKILVSVMSMLVEPNDESGANIDACKLWRTDRDQYHKAVRRIINKTLDL